MDSPPFTCPWAPLMRPPLVSLRIETSSCDREKTSGALAGPFSLPFATLPLKDVPRAVLNRASQDDVAHSAFVTVAMLRNLVEYRQTHLHDDATARKWKPPVSPLVAAGVVAKPLDRYTCLFQPTQQVPCIPAVGACDRCGHLGHAGSLCRADTSSTAWRLLRLALPQQPAALTGLAPTAPAPQTRPGTISQDQLRQILLAASLTPTLQAMPEAAAAEAPAPAAPNSPPHPSELVALQAQLMRERQQITELRATLARERAAAAAAAQQPAPTAPPSPPPPPRAGSPAGAASTRVPADHGASGSSGAPRASCSVCAKPSCC